MTKNNTLKNRFNQLLESTLGNVKPLINEEILVNNVPINTQNGQLSIAGCKYNISALGFNVGRVEYVKDKGGELEVKFDDKTKSVDKEQVMSQIGKFKGCPQNVSIDYEISSFLPNININFNKV